SGAALTATKRDIYEKAMAIVAAIRQGQFLPRQFAIVSVHEAKGAKVYYIIRLDVRQPVAA
ncbi:MAG TPA: hypothetical protein VMF69_13920, partial [Gemmataceae bacterium]|nr:hypothetical protein [Gemmataceae bacterium]